MMSTGKLAVLLVIIVLINLIEARFSEVPPPPRRPDRFHSRDELKRYLQKVHEYHSIVGRWRLRRDSVGESIDDDLFQPFLDKSSDDLFQKRSEFHPRLMNQNLD